MTKLTRKERNNFPSHDFAVPGKKKLPINDETHTDMAWKMVDRTGDLTDEERSSARSRIIRRAHKLGMDTKNWHAEAYPQMNHDEFEALMMHAFSFKDPDEHDHELQAESEIEIQSFNLSAMAIEMPPADGHPNRIPFKGILTRLDQASDAPLGGSKGKRVILPKEVAEKALSTLLGMGVDFKGDFSGHDAQQKFGFITEAVINGDKIEIEGFFYGADFPQVVKRVQAEKARLGFSYEAQVQTRSQNDDPLVITQCVFTGAAVLYKDKAAYRNTSLTASADEDKNMNDEMIALFKKLDERLEKIEANASTPVTASGSLCAAVAPHAEKLHQIANDMQSARVGMHPDQGHAHVIRNVANDMMAQASVGRLPQIYQTDQWLDAAKGKGTVADELDNDKFMASAAAKALKEENDNLKVELDNLKKTKFDAATPPPRGTVDAPNDKTVIKKVTAGDAKTVRTFDVLYAEAGEKGKTRPEDRTAYALTQMRIENNRGAN